jgi:hypothetical protein
VVIDNVREVMRSWYGHRFGLWVVREVYSRDGWALLGV